MKRFREAAEKYREAERALNKASKKSFPVGSRVEWQHGHFRRSATVIGHSDMFTDLIVRSLSGREYRVDAYSIIGVFHEKHRRDQD